jgi:pSer/pThr/pTyr-binding forkhead associated (FHA) protein
MIQLQVLSGKMAGENKIVRHFPFHIGRLPENHLCLDEPGVWDHHLTVEFLKDDGFFLSAAPDAFTTVNDHPQVTTRLVNGDVIAFGSAKIQFWLAPARQRALFARELGVWLLIIGITALQAVLVFLLVK